MVVFRFRTNSQSDSEGSVSSGETLHAQSAPVKCRWLGCGEWFGQLESLASHVTSQHAIPGKGGLFYCHWEACNRAERGFNARYKMLVHMRTHTNEKPHHCFQCDKSFSRAENLKIHARSHTGERPYVCPVDGCGKAYSNSSDRFKHTRTHSVDKPYMCKVEGCSKRYTDPSSLRKHVKTYRHYPNSNIKVPKLLKDNESLKVDLERRLSVATPMITSSPDNSQLAYTPMESSQTNPVIASACYDRSKVLIPNHTVILADKRSEPIGMSIDVSIPNNGADLIYEQFDSTMLSTNGSSPTIYNDELNRISPSYADQVRHSMSPPLYIEDYGRATFEVNFHSPPTSRSEPYYIFYSYPDTPSHNQEQEVPLDLSVHH